MSCLSETFQLEFAGTDFTMPKASARRALEWDVGTNGQVEWEIERVTTQEVRIVGHETNDFLQLIGIGKLAFRSRFEVSAGVITQQVHEVDWGDTSIDEALRPAVEWATAREPDELAAIYPEGRLEYTRDMGERWVSLLRRWRAATV